MAPRFEKKVVPAETEDCQPKHIYYDGELCEAETLPNGFTKIRKETKDAKFQFYLDDLFNTYISILTLGISFSYLKMQV